MRALLLILVSVCITLASGLTYEVDMYESADVNNYVGPITSDKTNIDFVIIHEEYIQLKGTDSNGKAVGYMFILDESKIIKTGSVTRNNYIVVKDDVLYCLVLEYGNMLTVVNVNTSKIEVFILKPYNEY